MQHSKLGRSVWLAAIPAALMLSTTSVVKAVYPNPVSTFDTAASFTNNNDNSGDAGSWYNNFNPPPPNVRLDYANDNASDGLAATTSETWKAGGPLGTYDAGGNPNSGSLALSWTFTAADAAAGSGLGFTIDILNTPTNFTSLSFYLMVDPSSAVDAYGGYGYFSVATRGQGNYTFDDTVSADGELQNPNYSNPASPGAGVWTLYTIPLHGADATGIQGITFNFSDSSDRNIVGTDTVYIDDVSLVGPSDVPEPASLALLGLSLPTLLLRRRRA